MSEKKTKDSIILGLESQIVTEKRLVELYEETSELIISDPARWLLKMLQLDSRKHIEIISMAIKILEGEKLGQEYRQEVSIGLDKHLQLENISLEKARDLMKSPLIKENLGLSRLLNLWMEDEKDHHNAINALKRENFTRENLIYAYMRYRMRAWESVKDELSDLIHRK